MFEKQLYFTCSRPPVW